MHMPTFTVWDTYTVENVYAIPDTYTYIQAQACLHTALSIAHITVNASTPDVNGAAVCGVSLYHEVLSLAVCLLRASCQSRANHLRCKIVMLDVYCYGCFTCCDSTRKQNQTSCVHKPEA